MLIFALERIWTNNPSKAIIFLNNDFVGFTVDNREKEEDISSAFPLVKEMGMMPRFPASNSSCMASTSSLYKASSGWPLLSQLFQKPHTPASGGWYSIYSLLLEKDKENEDKKG